MGEFRPNKEVATLDPRTDVISERLAGVRRLISVASGKGGVGKSLISATLALLLSKRGHKVGLLDLDVHGPSIHLIFGLKNARPIEDRGLVPPKVHGIELMSTVFFTRDRPVFLRGADTSNSVRELLALTRWGSLDCLLIDMPPGMGEETLDVIGLMKRAEFLVITTPSKMALASVKKLLRMLKELEVPIIGAIENMRTSRAAFSTEKQMKELEVPFLGQVRYDRSVDNAVGDVSKLLKTKFARDVKDLLPTVISESRRYPQA
jgi:ATP-binding protein involved in chromosome partitioning